MKNLIFILIFILPSAALYAQDFNSKEDNQKAYNETYQICSQKNYSSEIYDTNKEQLKLFIRGFESFYNPQSMFVINPQTKNLITSDGYWRALADCYPNNENRWMTFTTSLILMDAGGHAAGLASYYTIGKAVKWLSATQWALAHPSLVTWTMRATLVAGFAFAIKMTKDFINLRKQDRYVKAHPTEALDLSFQEFDALYAADIQVMKDRLDEVNDELAHNKLDKHCLKMPADNREKSCHQYLLERQSALQYKLSHQ